MSSKLTIIIPARNEEATIVQTLQSLIKNIHTPVHYVVVNDHSTDATEQVVNKFAQKRKDIIVVSTGKGKGGFAKALAVGFKHAKTEYVLPVMADLCDNPKTINKMLEKTNEDWDVICGSRYSPGGRKLGGPLFQGVMSRLICWSLYKLLSLPTKDVSNSFKMYRRALLNKIKINSSLGVEASMHLLLQAYFRGAKITEVPTSWIGRSTGQSKFKLLERSPRYLKIYVWAVKKKYL